MGGPGGSDSGGSCSLHAEPGALFTAASVFCPEQTFSLLRLKSPVLQALFFLRALQVLLVGESF